MSSNARTPPAVLKRLPQGKTRFLLGELIGARVAVCRSSCRDLVGLEGRIEDETLNTFVLHTGKGLKRVPKRSCTFAFPDAGVEVDGSILAVRSEERTKRLSSLLT